MLEHRFAKVTALATFALLVIGGTVNPTGSSLACPEPTFVCHGQLFPPMLDANLHPIAGVFYEHGHRLFAMTVALLQIALTTMLLVFRPRLRILACVLGLMIMAQAALGAITVAFKLPWFVSTGHFTLGMSYFGMLVYTAFRTRPAASPEERERFVKLKAALGPARKWILVAMLAVICQLLLGALVRHLGAAMVCLGVPSCTIGGDYWPDEAVQKLHMVHRGFGCVVALVTIVASAQVYRRAAGWTALRRLMVIAPLLVLAQIGLGVMTVLSLRFPPLAVAHFAGAASLWALWLSAWLLTGTRDVSMRRRGVSDAGEAVVGGMVSQ